MAKTSSTHNRYKNGDRMSLIRKISLISSMSMIIFAAFAYAEEPTTLRMLCYNIRNASGLDNVTDYDRTAQVMRDAQPDLIAIQELDCKTRRSGGDDRLAELAQRTGLVPSYGAAIEYQGGQYGVGILSKEKPLATRTVPLPGREEKRVLLIAEFPEYVFFCTHFSLTAEDRLASVRIIADELAKYPQKAVFLAGDLNCEPTEAPIIELQKSWKILSSDGMTFPADVPEIRIDYILGANLPASWTLMKHCVVEEAGASDHRPIFVQLETSAP